MTNANRAFLFYAITLALAVAVAFVVPFIGEASLVVTMMTPTIATVIMLTVIAPEGGLRKVLSLLGLDRAGFKGWPLAIAGPAAIHLAGLVILSVAGLAVFVAPQIDRFHRLCDLQNINGPSHWNALCAGRGNRLARLHAATPVFLRRRPRHADRGLSAWRLASAAHAHHRLLSQHRKSAARRAAVPGDSSPLPASSLVSSGSGPEASGPWPSPMRRPTRPGKSRLK